MHEAEKRDNIGDHLVQKEQIVKRNESSHPRNLAKFGECMLECKHQAKYYIEIEELTYKYKV